MNASVLMAIVTEDVADKALDIATAEGIKGATILPASGISQSPATTFFGLTFQDTMKMLVWIAETEKANLAAKVMKDKLNLDSPRQGLALTLQIDQLHGLNL
ncbi:MAG: hypothetical protein LAT62_10060 [Natronospirillum sp.]|uniref:hypothetical protein n=1 Tax=Natronospirillum sp. TaxID=2812955 RepID=UPI0025DFB3F3|nr:hypothetical protein [Natronospirillum sp.]MCH8552270.1 hypothetical protein [Natronospirillum sp.]